MKYMMGIDNGGSSIKVVLFDMYGTMIAKVSRDSNVTSPYVNYMERDMEYIWMRNKECVREIMDIAHVSKEDVKVISFSGHGKGLYVTGKNGAIIYPGIASSDLRAKKIVDDWRKSGVEDWVSCFTSQKILPSQPAALLYWMKLHVPEIYKSIEHIFSIKDYIRYRFCGVVNAEYTDMSGTSLMNIRKRCYDTRIYQILGISEIESKLPILVESHQVCGDIQADIADELGLWKGTKIVAGMFDIDACAIGCGILSESQLCMIAGTWSINEYISKQLLDDRNRMNSIYGIRPYYVVEESSPTSAGNLEWIMKELLPDKDYEQINKMVSQSAVDTQVYYLPFLYGSNAHPDAKACFIGLHNYHNITHFVRAIFEGVAFSHAFHLQKLLSYREKPTAIRIAGGVVHSDVWLQIFADILQIPLEVVEEKETGCLGAAIAGAIGYGLFDTYEEAVSSCVHISKIIYPNDAVKEIYLKKFKTYQKIITGLENVWEDFV